MAAAVGSGSNSANDTESTSNNNNSENTDNSNNNNNNNNSNDNNNDNNNNNSSNLDNNDSDEKKQDNNNNKIEFLSWGMLPHKEIDKFYMDDENVDKNCTPQTWSNCEATTFEVRKGPDYTPGQKAPSQKALYTVFGIDTYKSPTKINKISQFVNLTDKIEEMSKKCESYDYDKWPLPPIIILNMMIPDYSPPLLGTGPTDGEGFSLIVYAELSDETREELIKLYNGVIKKSELSPAIKLLSKFIHASETRDSNQLYNHTNKKVNNYGMSQSEIDQILQRFKVIVRVMNYQKTQMPLAMAPIVKQYNAKPFLARTSSSFYHNPGKYFAVDIDAHIFGKLARKSLGYLRDCMDTVVFDGAFVIEGQKNEELPEQVLCSARISKIGAKVAKEFPQKLLDIYLKRKEDDEHTHTKHDCNSQSMMNLKTPNSPTDNKNGNNNNNSNDKSYAQTTPLIDRTELGGDDDNDGNNQNNDKNNNASNKNDTMATVDSNKNAANGHA